MDKNPPMTHGELMTLCLDPGPPPIIEVDVSLLNDPELDQTLRAMGCFVATIDPGSSHDKGGLLQALYEACNFPGYFGFNWDALLDCLCDFSWQPATAYILKYKAIDLLDPTTADTFIDVLKDASQLMGEYNYPLKLLIPNSAASSP